MASTPSEHAAGPASPSTKTTNTETLYRVYAKPRRTDPDFDQFRPGELRIFVGPEGAWRKFRNDRRLPLSGLEEYRGRRDDKSIPGPVSGPRTAWIKMPRSIVAAMLDDQSREEYWRDRNAEDTAYNDAEADYLGATKQDEEYERLFGPNGGW